MPAREAAGAILLVAAAAFATLAALGIVRSRNALAALHALGIASVMVPPLVLLAVVVVTGFGISSLKTLCLALIVLCAGPVTGHAIAMAEHRRNPRL